jgi:hypothetical protein
MSNQLSDDEYLTKNVRVLVEPLIATILREKPAEPILFMIDWLEKIAGQSSSGHNTEREELNALKKEVKKFKKKV